MATDFFDSSTVGSSTWVRCRVGRGEKFPFGLRLAIILGLSALLWGVIIFFVAN